MEDDNQKPPKKSVTRKKFVDLKAVAALLEEPETDDKVHSLSQNKEHEASFRPNEELLQSTARIKTQRDLIQKRIRKMETNKERVSKSVFDKVKRDYSLQLENVNRLLNEKKDLLNKELKNVYMLREKQTVEINRHKEILEEARFRHYLEEFSEEQYKEVEEYESREINHLQSVLSQIQSYIRIHEELLDPEDFSTSDVTKTMVTSEQKRESAPLFQPDKSPINKKEETSTPSSVEAKIDFDLEDLTDKTPQPQQQPVQPKEMAPQIAVEKKEDILDTKKEKEPIQQPQDFILPEPEPSKEDVKEDIEDAMEFSTTDSVVKDPTLEESPSELNLESEDKGYFQTDESSESEEEAIEAQPPKNLEKQPLKIDTGKTLIHGHDEVTNSEPESIFDVLEEIPEKKEPVQPPPPPPPPQTPSVTTSSGKAPQSKTISKAPYKLLFTGSEGGEELDIKEFPLKDDNMSIGRSPSNDLVLKAPKVSRQHAAINKYKDQYLIIDLKSSNGVFVNGRKIDEYSLQEGDEISIGGYKMIFQKS